MNTDLDFHLFRPKGETASRVQGIWSASIAPTCQDDVKHWLHCDAGSGIVINLGPDIYLGDQCLSLGAYRLPVSKQAKSIKLSPGASLVGVRFLPGAGEAWLGDDYRQAKPAAIEEDADVGALRRRLRDTRGHYQRIVLVYRWLSGHKALLQPLPSALTTAMSALDNNLSLASVGELSALSQRQIERYFRRWLDMTPKYYQRIIRTRQTLNTLKHASDDVLADVALTHGFTDQAHMTRELKQLAKITPRLYRQYSAA